VLASIILDCFKGGYLTQRLLVTSQPPVVHIVPIGKSVD